MDQDEQLAIQELYADFDWSVFAELEEPQPDYDNSGGLDINLYSADAEVEKAAEFVCEEIGYALDRAVTHMKVVLLNLYWTNHLCPGRWVGVSLRKTQTIIPFRYNPQQIALFPLTQVLRGLLRQKYIIRQKGFFNRALKTGRCTRIKATDKLIDLLIDRFGFTVDMVGRHPDEETICLKDVKKKPKPYTDRRRTTDMRKFLNAYNTLLQQTYIDVDPVGYIHEKTLRRKSSEYLLQLPRQLNFNLSKKKMRRVFNNGSFTQGGRFYGGFWMEMPSDLRLRIILDHQKVIEADYSGIHIHLLYNKIGIDYGVKQEDPYAIPGYPATPKYRNLFKKLLLAAVNAQDDKKRTGETRAIMALQESINFNVSDYPDVIPDLYEVIAAFKKHHDPIAKFLFTGIGYWLMYKDSQIAELVMKIMYGYAIPVLPVHDSFICPKQHKALLLNAMTRAYRKVTGNKLTVTPYTVNIKEPDEWDMTDGNPELTDDCFYFDISLSKNDALIKHMIQLEGDALFDDEEDDEYTETEVVTPHTLFVTVPIKYSER